MAIDSTLRSPLTLRLVAAAVDRTLGAHRPPPGDARTSVPGPDPVRLLLVGAGTALGYGVESRSEALEGHLADMLARQTGRGVVVDTRLEEELTLDQTVDLLDACGAEHYDAVVWSPTFREVTRFQPRRNWARAVGRLVGGLRAAGGPNTGVVLLGLPEVLTTTSLGDAAVVQLRRLNERIAAAATAQGACFVPVPVVRPIVGEGHVLDSFYYARCAAELLPAVTGLLTERAAVRV